jgi:5-methyltetrahydropteroyltriglutamate--homocysteine methyltransferase
VIVTAAGNYPRIADSGDGQRLRRAIAQMDDGRMDREGLRRVQDDVVSEVIEEQIEAGLDLVTDGLIRWDDAVTYLARGLGFKTEGLVRYLDTNTFFREPLAQGPIAWPGPITVRDWQYAAGVSSKPVKAVLTGPYSLGCLSRGAVHHSEADLVLELAVALRFEVMALHQAGAPLVQIDEPLITRRDGDWPLFERAERVLLEGVSGRVALNASFGGVGHLPGLFELPFQVFGLDFVQGPGNWEVAAALPSDRELIAGIVDARDVRIESVDEIAAALNRLARMVSAERLGVSPNCGLEFLPRATAQAKLRRTAEGARLFLGQHPVAAEGSRS